MFDMIAEVVIGLLKSLYGLSVSVASSVINLALTGKLRLVGAATLPQTVLDAVWTSANTRTTHALLINSSGAGDIILGDGSATSHPIWFSASTNLPRLQMSSGGYFCWTGAASNESYSQTSDTGFRRLAAGVIGVNAGPDATSTLAWVQNSAGEARRTATQTVTDSATFVADDTLTATLIAGRKYRFYLFYYFTTINTSGVKIDLNGGGATMTAINGVIQTITPATYVTSNVSQITALTSSAALTAAGVLHYACAEGTLQCNAAGTFIPRFAQNAETGAAESVIAQIGSFLTLSDMP